MVLVLWSINKLIKCEKKKNDCLFGWQKCSKCRIYSFSHAKWKFALLKSNFGYQCNQWKLDWLQILCFFLAHFCSRCIRIQSLWLCSFQWVCACVYARKTTMPTICDRCMMMNGILFCSYYTRRPILFEWRPLYELSMLLQ